MSDRARDRLERLLDEKLRALPEIAAPATLLDRVMRVVQEREGRAWWQGSWEGWPSGLQVLGMLGLLVMVGVTSYMGSLLVEEARSLGVGVLVGTWLEPVWRVWDLLGTLWGAAALVFRAVGQPLLWLAVVFVMGVYFACVGLGTACTRLAMVRTRGN